MIKVAIGFFVLYEVPGARFFFVVYKNHVLLNCSILGRSCISETKFNISMGGTLFLTVLQSLWYEALC